MTRRRYHWDSVLCDRSLNITELYKVLNQIRPYFYESDAEADFLIDAFPFGNHNHYDGRSPASELEFHPDEHDGYPFHIHVNGYIMARALWRVQVGHAVVLAYFLTFFAVLIYHMRWTPRIRKSRRELCC